MTERIKLTEETLRLIIQGFDNDLGNNIGVYDISKEEKIREGEEMIIQQILENQEKAEKLDRMDSMFPKEEYPHGVSELLDSKDMS